MSICGSNTKDMLMLSNHSHAWTEEYYYAHIIQKASVCITDQLANGKEG